MNPSVPIAILLALYMPMAFAGLSRAEPDDEHGLCGVAARAMQEEIERMKAELGKDLQAKALLNHCAQAYTEHYDSCSNPKFLASMGCKPKPAAVPNAKASITGSADTMAAELVQDSNCKRRIEQCITRGGIGGPKKELDVWKKCFNGETPTYAPIANPVTPRDRDASARNLLGGRIAAAQERYKKCLRERGDAAEKLARQTLEDSMAARSDGTRPGLSCIEKGSGLRECEVSANGERFTPADGQREDSPLRDKDADQDNPAQVTSATGHCSGTVLGNGSEAVTAGHCLKGSGPQEVELKVRDANGELQTVKAQCQGEFGGVYYNDLARCTLSQPIKANPVYFATHDPSIRGPGCIDEGYTKRCGSEFFQNLTNKPVTVWGYPGDQGLTKSTGTFTGITESGWIWRNGVLHNNLICTQGCSGSGFIIDVGGQRVVVGAASFAPDYGAGMGASVPTYSQWQGLKIQSISTGKLMNATLLFTELQ